MLFRSCSHCRGRPSGRIPDPAQRRRRRAMKKILAAAGVAAAIALGFVALTGFHGERDEPEGDRGGFVALTGFHGGCGGHGHPRDPAQLAALVTDRVNDVLDDLDATPDQRTRIDAVKDRLLADAQKARAGHEEVHAALLGEWKADAPDAKKLHALVDERIEALRGMA